MYIYIYIIYTYWYIIVIIIIIILVGMDWNHQADELLYNENEFLGNQTMVKTT